jgi:polar amino acid transport system substrate-binding protein
MTMTMKFERRAVLRGGAALGAMLLSAPAVLAQSGGMLKKLQDAGKVTLGVPQTPPWSEIKPDGSLGGIAPEILMPAFKGLGINECEAVPTTYAELIPGLMAGRWDVIGACLTISKARCEAVKFTSPFTFGYLSVAYRPDEMKNPPLSLEEAAKSGLKIATNGGGYQLSLLRSMTPDSNLLLFEDTASVIEAVANKRADIGLDAIYGMAKIKTGVKIAFTPAMTDTGYDESCAALRHQDLDLYEALDGEIMKLKASGFVAEINRKYGYEYDREKFDPVTSDFACENANT